MHRHVDGRRIAARPAPGRLREAITSGVDARPRALRPRTAWPSTFRARSASTIAGHGPGASQPATLASPKPRASMSRSAVVAAGSTTTSRPSASTASQHAAPSSAAHTTAACRRPVAFEPLAAVTTAVERRPVAVTNAPTIMATAASTASTRATIGGRRHRRRRTPASRAVAGGRDVGRGQLAQLLVGRLLDLHQPARLRRHRRLEQVAGEAPVAEALVPRLGVEERTARPRPRVLVAACTPPSRTCDSKIASSSSSV